MLKLILTLELLRRGYTHDDAMRAYRMWSFLELNGDTGTVGITGLVSWLETYYPDRRGVGLG
mgnify:CR=1 FL=1